MTLDTAALLLLLGVGITLANLMIFGLTLKLYTEYFKDVSGRNRK